MILTTVGAEGSDASPRGDIDSAVRIVDKHTLWLPNWRGNNRMDSLRNIVRDNRISLLFMVPGSNNVVRVNGTALITADLDVTQTVEHGNSTPRSVVVVRVKEVYFQCAKALTRLVTIRVIRSMRKIGCGSGEKATGVIAGGSLHRLQHRRHLKPVFFKLSNLIFQTQLVSQQSL